PFRIIVYGRVDAAALNFRGKAIHAEREYVHKPAQKVHVRARLRRARARAQADHHQHKQDGEKWKSSHVSHSRSVVILREVKEASIVSHRSRLGILRRGEEAPASSYRTLAVRFGK